MFLHWKLGSPWQLGLTFPDEVVWVSDATSGSSDSLCKLWPSGKPTQNSRGLDNSMFCGPQVLAGFSWGLLLLALP